MARKMDIAKPTASDLTTTERGGEPRYVKPPVDVYENESEYLLLADLPGVEPEALRVALESNELRIEGEVHGAEEPLTYHRRFTVGPGIDPSGISAELVHGVLRVTARKSEALRPRRIEVRAV